MSALFAAWRLLPSSIRWAAVGAAVVAIVAAGAYLKGRADYASSARAKAAEARAEHINTARETENEIEALDDTGLRNALERWLLPSPD